MLCSDPRPAHCARSWAASTCFDWAPCVPILYPEVTAAAAYNGALEPKLCTVPGLPGNAVYLILGPTVWLYRIGGSPTTSRATWFMYKQCICLKHSKPIETVYSRKKKRRGKLGQRQKTKSGSLVSVTEMWHALDMKSGYQSPRLCSKIYSECQLSPLWLLKTFSVLEKCFAISFFLTTLEVKLFLKWPVPYSIKSNQRINYSDKEESVCVTASKVFG